MVTGIPAHWWIPAYAVVLLVLVMWTSYHTIARVFKWLTLVLFAYVLAAFLAHPDWERVLRVTLWPEMHWSREYLSVLVAILGTSISPYLFFWQAAQEVEEQRRTHAKPLCVTPATAGKQMAEQRQDTLVGMAFSNVVAIFIVFAAATTLHANGITTIQTAAEAAQALEPVAGRFAFALFAIGIIGTGLLAVPVLAGSAAYAVSEMLGRPASLDAKPLNARLFYGTIAVTTLAGALLQSIGVNPVRALYWSAVINGVLAAPLMVIMMLIVRNPRAMGKLTAGARTTVLGWIATAIMAAATIIFFASLVVG